MCYPNNKASPWMHRPDRKKTSTEKPPTSAVSCKDLVLMFDFTKQFPSATVSYKDLVLVFDFKAVVFLYKNNMTSARSLKRNGDRIICSKM